MSRLELKGYREHASAHSTSVNAVGQHEISNHIRLTTVFNYYNAPYLLNPSSLSRTEAATSPAFTRFFVKQQGSGKEIRQGQGGITLKYRDDGANHFEAALYGLSRSLLNPIPGRIIDLDRKAGGIRAVFSKSFQIRGSLLRCAIGTDYETQNDTRVEFNNQGIPRDKVGVVEENKIFDLLQYGPRLLDQKEKVFGIGPFAELELAFKHNWVLTLGGRYDRYQLKVSDRFIEDGADHSGTRNMDEFSPMVGLTYRPLHFMTAYANYSTAFQTPTTTELSNRPTQEGGFNPDLQPERIRSIELGLKGMWPQKNFSYDLAVYVLNIADMLIPYQIQDPGSEENFFRNAGRARNKGAEVKFEWVPVKGLRASIAYTFMNFVFKDFLVETSSGDTVKHAQLAGNDVPGVPPRRLFAGIAYEHKVGAYAEINLQWSDRYFANDFNGSPPGGNKPVRDFINDAYLTVDMRLGVQREIEKVGVEIFLGINNFFNKRYNGSIVPNASGDRFFEPAAGRSWYVGINVPFSN